MTEEEMDVVNDQIAALFEGKSLDDVANILKVQLAMLVTQGSENAEDATEFLDEITDAVEELVRTFDFEAGDDDSAA